MAKLINSDAAQVKLQVHMPKVTYDELHKLAEELGFDSAPALVRFWAAAETRKNKEPSDENLGKPSVQAVRYIELLLATKEEEPANLEMALEYVQKQLRRQQSRRYLDRLVRQQPLY